MSRLQQRAQVKCRINFSAAVNFLHKSPAYRSKQKKSFNSSSLHATPNTLDEKKTESGKALKYN